MWTVSERLRNVEGKGDYRFADVFWINASVVQDELPIPMIAALAHYQFATIHPYYHGNGRTARLLTTFILHRYGYGLKGIYALEAYYARKLEDYYNALDVGEGHNYYVGNRAEADVTGFIEYFVRGMANSFAKVREQRVSKSRSGSATSRRLFGISHLHSARR